MRFAVEHLTAGERAGLETSRGNAVNLQKGDVMHDPMVVAWEVPLFIPKRDKWRDKHYSGHRWGFTRKRFTNPEHLGQPIERWWHPSGYTFALAGRVLVWRRLATIWHVEPGGHDSGEVCKHYTRWQDNDGKWHGDPMRAWKWHVHHWHIQIPWLQGIRARLFDRCALCGRKGRPNVSHQWDGHRLGWWKFRSREGLYHSECSGLLSYRNAQVEHEIIHRRALAELALAWDCSIKDVPRRLFPGTDGYRANRPGPGDFNLWYRLEKMLDKEQAKTDA